MSWDESGRVVEAVRGVPAGSLRPFIGWYSGYRYVGVPPGRHRGLPSPYLTMIVSIDEPLEVAVHPDPGQPPGEYLTLVGGLHTVPAVVTHPGRQSGIQVHLRPLGARLLLGMPAGELAGLDTDGDLVLGPVAIELHERVRGAASWEERFAVVDEVLLRLMRDEKTVSLEVGRAWERLVACRGLVSVGELAQEAGWSTRRLSARFRDEIGLGPKEAARVVRFDRARRLLQRRVAVDGPLELAALATACGYYDQAHLAREFRSLAGCPPSRWVAEEFRNVQAAADLELADSWA